MNLLNRLLNEKWLRLTFAILLIQQSMIATGTYLMGEMASRIASQGFRADLAAALFFCVAVPGTLLHFGVSWSSTRTGKSILRAYLDAYASANYNHPAHWRNQASRSRRHDVMCRSGQDAIQSTLHFIVDVCATLFNIAFNTLSVILVTDRTLGLAIVLAGATGLSVIHLSDRKISEAAEAEMSADNRLNAHLSRSWDNIVLGNSFFFGRWKSRLDELFSGSEAAALNGVRNRDRAIALAGFLTTSVVVGTGLGLAWKNSGNTALVVSLLIMLPRSLQIVMHIQIVQSYWAQWKSLREKIRQTQETLDPPEATDLNAHIQASRIHIKSVQGSAPASSHQEFSAGRHTLLGPNGAGKSCLLLNLKQKMGERALYLPTHHQLEPSLTGQALSSGQSAMAVLEEISGLDVPVLLLDEWDANLSEENLRAQDALIQRLSRDRIVIEVRHPRV